MPYEFLEDIATADIAFRAWGKNLEELFIAAGDATINTMIDNIEAIAPKEIRTFNLENEDLDMLLFNFLQEIIYYKDSEQLLLRAQHINICQENNKHLLKAITAGETITPEKHQQRVDVKAVTLHRFQLEKTANGWQTFVILDI